MAFFAPRSSASFYEPNYSGLFRLIDEFNNYAAEAANDDVATASSTSAAAAPGKRRSAREPLAIWTPKFDLHETPNTYVMHGEFPGLDKKDINIEFTDDQTLTIRGRSERSHTRTSDDDDDVVMVDKDKAKEQQAKEGEPAKDKEAGGKEVTHQDKSKQQVGAHQQQPKYKYWVSERSFGEFARTFTFPARVDPSGVVAKLDNGVLNLVVPKAHKAQGRKITVQ